MAQITTYRVKKMKNLLVVMKMHLSAFTIVKSEGKTDEEWEFDHEQMYNFI